LALVPRFQNFSPAPRGIFQACPARLCLLVRQPLAFNTTTFGKVLPFFNFFPKDLPYRPDLSFVSGKNLPPLNKIGNQ